MLEKWSINRLAEESGMDRRTVKKRLEKAEPCDFTPEQDPLYRLRTFLDALREHDEDGASNLDKERTRLTKAQADQAELNLSIARNEVLPVEVAFQACSNVLFAVRRSVETCEFECPKCRERQQLPNETKDAVYNEIQGFTPESIVSEKKFEEGKE